MSALRIFIDGACRGNPGPGSVGVVVQDAEGNEVRRHGRALGVCTNNVAEYTALSDALDLARKLGGTRLDIFSDSQLLVRQYAGLYKVKNPRLRAFLQDIRAKARGFEAIRLTHVPRERNKEADATANEALDAASA